jgi:hypothetical protein
MRAPVILFLAVTALLLGAGCSDDDKNEPAKSSTDDQQSTTTSAEDAPGSDPSGSDDSGGATGEPTSTTLAPLPSTFTKGDKTAYCDAYYDLFAKSFSQPEADEIKPFYRELAEIEHRMLDASSTEVRSSLEYTVKALDEVARTGSRKALTIARYDQNNTRLLDYSKQICPIGPKS